MNHRLSCPRPYRRVRRLRLNEKGGKVHEMPAHHNLEAYLDAYMQAAGLFGAKGTPLFRSADWHGGALTALPMHRVDVWRMIRRRAEKAGIDAALRSARRARCRGHRCRRRKGRFRPQGRSVETSRYRVWLPAGHALAESERVSVRELTEDPLVLLNQCGRDRRGGGGSVSTGRRAPADCDPHTAVGRGSP